MSTPAKSMLHFRCAELDINSDKTSFPVLIQPQPHSRNDGKEIKKQETSSSSSFSASIGDKEEQEEMFVSYRGWFPQLAAEMDEDKNISNENENQIHCHQMKKIKKNSSNTPERKRMSTLLPSPSPPQPTLPCPSSVWTSESLMKEEDIGVSSWVNF